MIVDDGGGGQRWAGIVPGLEGPTCVCFLRADFPLGLNVAAAGQCLLTVAVTESAMGSSLGLASEARSGRGDGVGMSCPHRKVGW